MSECVDVGVNEDVDGDGDLNVAVGDEPPYRCAHS